MAVFEVSYEIWNGESQFGPLNTGVVDRIHFKSSKALSHLSVQMKSIFHVNAYSGVAI